MNIHSVYQVACCIRTTAAQILETHELHVPQYGGVSHKGPDLECCDYLTVWWDNTEPKFGVAGEDKCSDPKTRVFVVELGLPVCTEQIELCKKPDQFCDTDDDGCFIPDPVLGDGECGKNAPTLDQETAAIWAARYLLEEEIPCAIECCIRDCALGRCRSVTLQSTISETQGGCSMTQIRFEVVW